MDPWYTNSRFFYCKISVIAHLSFRRRVPTVPGVRPERSWSFNGKRRWERLRLTLRTWQTMFRIASVEHSLATSTQDIYEGALIAACSAITETHIFPIVRYHHTDKW